MIELNIWLGSPLKHIKKNLALFLYTVSCQTVPCHKTTLSTNIKSSKTYNNGFHPGLCRGRSGERPVVVCSVIL